MDGSVDAPATPAQVIDQIDTELSELRQAADRLDEAVATQFGLNRTDLRCLGILYRRGRMTAGELADESGLSPGATTTALDRMERGGFANRVADPSDRRRVVVVSTIATREIGARLFGEIEVATRADLEGRSFVELVVVRDYLRRTRELYEAQAPSLQAPASAQGTAGGEGGAGPAGAAQAASAPLLGVTSGRLEFAKGAGSISITGDPALADLYQARFDGPTPEIRVQGGTIAIVQKRRFRPFDWRGLGADVTLNATVPWAIDVRGGMWQLNADLRRLTITSVDIKGGASNMEVWLPEPHGTVPVRIAGGASQVSVHRPAGVAIRAVLTGGASELSFDGQRRGSLAGSNHLESAGFNDAADRYEVRFSGGASQVTVDNASPAEPAG
jgi:DNA-binding MarR family transcriptional regulator